jgi:prolyl oligopeptidase
MIQDPYRWLEYDTAAEVEAWVKAQNDVTFGYLASIPFRDTINKRLAEVYNYPKYGLPFKVGKYLIYPKNDGLQNQAVYYIQQGEQGTAEVLIDPNQLAEGGTASISLLGASMDDRYLAYAQSMAGSDWRTIYILDLETRTKLSDELQWVKFSGAAWDANGFYYSRYAAPTKGEERSAKNEYHKVYYHKLGDPQGKDKLVYEDLNHPLRYHSADITEDGRYLLLRVAEGTDGFEVHYMDLVDSKRVFKPLFSGFNTKSYVLENVGTDLLVLTNYEAPNYRVVRINPAKNTPAEWKPILPEKSNYLSTATVVGGRLVATYLQDVTHRVYTYALDGTEERPVPLPGLGTASGFGGKQTDSTVYFSFSSFLSPNLQYSYHLGNGTATQIRASEVQFDANAYDAKQVFFTSTDSVRVPMFIVHKKGIPLNGKNPTLLYAYGGFNISLSPGFDPTLIPLLENGGVYALANIRGGGEYGETWHKAGMLDKKQQVFDDFIAAARYLITEQYTSPQYLAIEGGSNGGLLVGAVLTQQPDLFRVAFPMVGVLDMLRFHKFTVGWGWVPEYGSSERKDQFDYLLKYSPLHNVKENMQYPSTMIFTADHDDRVVPAHSFKFAAELQHRYKGKRPMLIRIQTQAGHGAGKPTGKLLEEKADKWAFMFYEMGIEAYKEGK